MKKKKQANGFPALPPKFAAFILTHGRPDNVKTYDSLKRSGFTGRVILLVDNEDKKLPEYQAKFGAEVVVFDKRRISAQYPNCDNFDDRRAVVYARNACFEVAKAEGITHLVQLDDDYTCFSYRADAAGCYLTAAPRIKSIDGLLASMCELLDASPIASIALAQGGDYAGGLGNPYIKTGWRFPRKIMNFWVCRTDRAFPFCGRMNEDVSAAVYHGSQGQLFFTFMQAQLFQAPTQAASGGMTETYQDNGTYQKSFYSVIQHPSSVTVSELHTTHKRFHHSIQWNFTVPKVVPESCRKK